MQLELFGRRGWEIQLRKQFCGFVPFTSLYSFCSVHSFSPKKYYKYRYVFNQSKYQVDPQQVILIFDCDPLIKRPHEFYYKDETSHAKLPGHKDGRYLDNSISLGQWLEFIRGGERLGGDMQLGKIEFLETLNEQEFRDEIFIDHI